MSIIAIIMLFFSCLGALDRIIGKAIAGILALVLANLIYKRLKKSMKTPQTVHGENTEISP